MSKSESWKNRLRQTFASWKGDGVVISPDVDGLLSFLLLRHLTGARMVGVYTTSVLIACNGAQRGDLRDALWLDHDVSQADVLSVGHHIIQYTPGDRISARDPRGFNPNEYFGQAYTNSFTGRNGRGRDKYPFATIHMLWSMFEAELATPGPEEIAFYLLAHADSAWTSPVNYGPNCKVWQEQMFPDDQVIARLVDRLDQTGDAAVLGRLVAILNEAGVVKASSRVQDPRVSKEWRTFGGNQSVRYGSGQDIGGFVGRLNAVASVLTTIMDWESSAPIDSAEVEAICPASKAYPEECARVGLNAFVEERKVFSHAFVSNSTLRYTPDFQL